MTQDPRYFRTGHVGPSGHELVARVDEGYVCDFCLSTEPTWEFPAGPVNITGHPTIGYTDDDWSACEECHRLIEQESIGALVERMVEYQRIHVPPGTSRGGQMAVYPPKPIARRVARENVRAFMEARTGPCRRFQA